MWDWEIVAYLEGEGISVIAPYTLAQTQYAVPAASVRRELSESKFLVFQDNPGEGFQAEIFKRFYWWENEAIQRMFEKFGVTIEKKSFREFGDAGQSAARRRGARGLVALGVADGAAGAVAAERGQDLHGLEG